MSGSEAAFTRGWAGYEKVPCLSNDRLRQMLAGSYDDVAPAEPELTPGMTVTPHVTDRHAPSDVGGRLDTTKGWRLTIPDPVTASRSSGDTSVADIGAMQ